MTILRTITCDLCGKEYTEREVGTGFPGWCVVQGIAKDNDPTGQSTFCPTHKERIAELIQELDKEIKLGGD